MLKIGELYCPLQCDGRLLYYKSCGCHSSPWEAFCCINTMHMIHLKTDDLLTLVEVESLGQEGGNVSRQRALKFINPDYGVIVTLLLHEEAVKFFQHVK